MEHPCPPRHYTFRCRTEQAGGTAPTVVIPAHANGEQVWNGSEATTDMSTPCMITAFKKSARFFLGSTNRDTVNEKGFHCTGGRKATAAQAKP